jgi:hypothetical protein
MVLLLDAVRHASCLLWLLVFLASMHVMRLLVFGLILMVLLLLIRGGSANTIFSTGRAGMCMIPAGV